MTSVMNPIISKAIVNAKEKYGNDITVVIDYDGKGNEKIFIMYLNSVIETFNYTEYTSAKDIGALCAILDLGFRINL